EEGLESRWVDLPREPRLAEQRLELGGEGELATRDAVVQGLDPEAVAGEHKPAVASIPDGDREHPAERLDEGGAPLFIQVDEDLGVAVGGERVPAASELVHQLAVV